MTLSATQLQRMMISMSPEKKLLIDGGMLRPLVIDDIYMGYVDGLNDPAVNKYLEVRFAIQTLESVAAFVEANRMSANSVLWGIWKDGISAHVGTVRIHGIDRQHGTAHIGICLFDKRVWGKGLGKNTIAAVTRWALEELGLRWVEAGIYGDNSSSKYAFESAGYSWVCDIPDKYLLNGKPITLRIFSARSRG